MQTQTFSKVRRLTESGVLLAVAFVLSVIKIIEMPFGGSVTLGCMFPIVLLAYRFGTGWGLLSAAAFSLLQLLTGLNNLSHATSWQAAVAIVLLDYIVAFAVLGLGGVFRKVLRNQNTALLCGVVLCCLLRYVCHVISGCTVWAGVSIPTSEGLLYSLSYNAAYMVPETLIAAGAAWYLGSVLDFRGNTLKRLSGAARGGWLDAVGLLAAVAAVVTDAVILFAALQGEDDFDITRMADANWWLLGGILAAGAVIFAVCKLVAVRLRKKA